MLALSIKQPWAHLIVQGYKDIENRSWRTNYRGRILIHAGRALDSDAADDLHQGRHPVTGETWTRMVGGYSRGGIVGEAEIADCVIESSSTWFVGPYGFVLRNARPLPFTPCRGMLGFFDPGV